MIHTIRYFRNGDKFAEILALYSNSAIATAELKLGSVVDSARSALRCQ